MGNVRTPKASYFDGGVVEFYVKNKQIYYKTVIWTKDGTKQFTFETGKYDIATNNIKEITNRALQNFSEVMGK